MGASPMTTAFLKECMADALLRALKEKPFTKITINEIAQSAGVNRSTWFRNFGSMQEALTFKLVTLWRRWADEHELTDIMHFNSKNAESFFAFNYSIRDILVDICRAGQQSCMSDAFYQLIMPQQNASITERYQAKFYAYGLFGLLAEWIMRDFKESPEELAGMLSLVMTEDTYNCLAIETKSRS